MSQPARLALLAVLTLDLFWAVGAVYFEQPAWWVVGLIVVGSILAWPVARGAWWSGWPVLGHAVATGIADRIARVPFAGSDVLRVTREAVEVTLAGADPYSHVYVSSPGAPFVYPPGEILYYAVGQRVLGRVEAVEQAAGIGLVVVLGLFALRVGPVRAAIATGLYATFGAAAYRSTDGSNDTSAALLVTVAVLLLALAGDQYWSSRPLFVASAAAFGFALLFKQTTWPILPFVVAHLRVAQLAWRSYAGIALGTFAVVSLPFFARSPADFMSAMSGALSYHPNVWGLNLWHAWSTLSGESAEGIDPIIGWAQLIVAGGLALALLRSPARSLAVAVLQGLAVVFVAMFLARWSTYSYYTYAGALLAVAVALYRVDLEEDPVRLPIVARPTEAAPPGR